MSSSTGQNSHDQSTQESVPNSSNIQSTNKNSTDISKVQSNSDSATNTANKSAQFPQTGNQSAFWTTELGIILLAIAGAFGFKRKHQN